MQRHPIAWFLALTMSLQYGLGILTRFSPIAQEIFEWGFSALPLVTLLVAGLTEGKPGVKGLLAPLVRWRVHPYYYLFAIFLLPGFFVLSNYVERLFQGDLSRPVPFTFWALIYPDAQLAALITCASVADEMAWFGYLFVRLQRRYSQVAASLITGVCWALWYIPMLLFSTTVADRTVPPVYFVLNFILLAPLCAWLYQSSKSALLVIAMNVIANYAYFVIPVLPQDAGGPTVFALKVLMMGLGSAFLIWLGRGKQLGAGG
ncbi:MAG: CPBP family intramembrane glutamic endopeptidase [Polyangiaceae bacterium]|nr:CPBP family intramembrane glutamic endopeptidase [Polyangiaceae bacterium]